VIVIPFVAGLSGEGTDQGNAQPADARIRQGLKDGRFRVVKRIEGGPRVLNGHSRASGDAFERNRDDRHAQPGAVLDDIPNRLIQTQFAVVDRLSGERRPRRPVTPPDGHPPQFAGVAGKRAAVEEVHCLEERGRRSAHQGQRLVQAIAHGNNLVDA